MKLVSASAIIVFVALAGCSAESASSSSSERPDRDDQRSVGDPSRPPFQPDFEPAPDAPPQPKPLPVDPIFDSRLKEQIRSVVHDDYSAHDWDALLAHNEPFSGVKIWIPGTTGRTADDLQNGRAMDPIPAGLASHGPALTFIAGVGGGSSSTNVWWGTPCSQSYGGALYVERGGLSALEVFNTAWSDAKEIAARLGPRLKGAWVVAHSAGANPALLAGLIGGAHRVDVYGVPSAVGALDGDDGLVHAHTHPLDPAGSMGKLGEDGKAQIDLFGAAATAIKAGGTMQYHKYGSWPAPSP